MSKPEFQIINSNQAKEIRKLVARCVPNDIHSHPDYLDMFSKYLSVELVYFLYGDPNDYILVPFFKKRLTNNEGGGEYFDLVSPWYYGGPIYCVNKKSAVPGLSRSLRSALNKYCAGNNIVSEFQRLNPAIDNYMLYKNDSGLVFNRETVCVDLRKSLEQIKKEYAYSVRKNIKTAERAGLNLIRSKTKDDWEKFVGIYLLSMQQKKAGDFYHFSSDFYYNFFDKFHNELEIFRVEYRGQTIAATLILGRYGTVHDYLRASLPQYLSFRPNDYTINGIINWAKNSGYLYYSLGGGLSEDVNDTVLKFKKTFSPDTRKFYVYKKIHNLEKYRQLCFVAGKKEERLAYEQASFFPEYPRL